MNTASRILKRYYLRAGILAAVTIGAYIAVGLLILLKFPDWLALVFPVALLLVVVNRILIRRIAAATIHRVLLRDLDGVTFNEVICRFRRASVMYHLSAAEAVGDHRRIEEIAAVVMETSKSVRIKQAILQILMMVFFEEQDREKLADVCDAYEANSEAGENPSKPDAGTYFYRRFLAGDYAACIARAEKRLDEVKEKGAYIALTARFRLAVSCAHAGDTDRAREIFQTITEAAPRMYLSELSRRWLEVLDEGDIAAATFPQTTEHFAYVPPRRSPLHIVIWCALGLVVIGLFISWYADRRADRRHDEEQKAADAAVREYESKLDAGFRDIGVVGEVLFYADVLHEGRHIATVCLVKEGDAVNLYSILTYDDGATSTPKLMRYGLECGTVYSVWNHSVPDTPTFDVLFTDNPAAIPSDAPLTKPFSMDGKPYWFCVTGFETAS